MSKVMGKVSFRLLLFLFYAISYINAFLTLNVSKNNVNR